MPSEEDMPQIDPDLPLPTRGGCYLRTEEGDLIPDPSVPAVPAEGQTSSPPSQS